ncbi:hypothetical protein LZ32DRAFT_421142 [Colletotrichum eremochloae]|nr:hypothetical protein LZ32DRAFT_421142 [Colletotrichum eremochloae]
MNSRQEAGATKRLEPEHSFVSSSVPLIPKSQAQHSVGQETSQRGHANKGTRHRTPRRSVIFEWHPHLVLPWRWISRRRGRSPSQILAVSVFPSTCLDHCSHTHRPPPLPGFFQ